MMRPALLIAAVVAAFGVATLVWYGWSDGDGDDTSVAAPSVSPAPQRTWSDMALRLGAINRQRLTICVDVVGEGDQLREIATENVRDALESVNEDGPHWFSEPAPVVDEGCPSEPALYLTREWGEVPFLLTALYGPAVDEPSHYDLFVFFIPDEDITEAEGEDRWRIGVEETLWEGDAGHEVTHGLYMSHQEVCDHDLIAGLLGYHLQLRAVYPLEPTPYHVPPMTFGVTPTPVPTPTPACY